MYDVTFDKDTHEYNIILNGCKTRIPSNNQILEYCGVKKPLTFINKDIQTGIDRGNYVDKACRKIVNDYDIPNDCNMYNIYDDAPEIYKAYIKSFIDWTIEYKPEFIETGKPFAFVQGAIMYAGTPDLIAKLDNKTILELKTGKKAKWHRYQLAGYGQFDDSVDLALLYLNDTYEYIPISKDDQSLLYSEYAGFVRKYWEENIFCV